MIFKLFYILLIHFFICKAEPRENGPLIAPPPGSGVPYTRNLNNGLQDCRPVVPESRSDQNQDAPLNTNLLVPHSLQDQRQQNQYPYVAPRKSVYDENDESDAKLSRNQTPNKDSEGENQKGQKPLQRESNPTELGKLVEKCLTNKLKSARRNESPNQNDKLDSEDLLNTRRNNPTDSTLEEDSLEAPNSPNELDESLADPAQAVGLRRLSNPNSNLLLMNNRKVCYACTSANNPNCWVPNSQTTVKYCNRANDGCVTKTYDAGNNKVIIRDCGNSCVDKDVGVHPEYTSCSICNSNLCNDSNGALNLHINFHSLILGIILITLVKRAV